MEQTVVFHFVVPLFVCQKPKPKSASVFFEFPFFYTAWPVFLVPQLRKSFDLDTGSETPTRLDQSHLCSRVSQVEATGSSRVVPTTYKALDMRLPKKSRSTVRLNNKLSPKTTPFR